MKRSFLTIFQTFFYPLDFMNNNCDEWKMQKKSWIIRRFELYCSRSESSRKDIKIWESCPPPPRSIFSLPRWLIMTTFIESVPKVAFAPVGNTTPNRMSFVTWMCLIQEKRIATVAKRPGQEVVWTKAVQRT